MFLKIAPLKHSTNIRNRMQGVFKANTLKTKISQSTTTSENEIEETDDDFHDAFKLLFQENEFFDTDDISETMQMMFAEPSTHFNVCVEKMSTLQSVTTTLISPMLYHMATRYIVREESETYPDNIRNIGAEEGRGDSN